MELTDALSEWEVTLSSGEVVIVAAHAYGQDEGRYTFSALMVGTPHIEVPVVSFPRTVVARVRSI